METLCVSCRRPKATLQCELCQEPLCKSCDQFLAADTFSFLPKLPEALTHTHYCPVCHGSAVEPELDRYREVMERAEKVYVFFKTQKRPPPVLKRSHETVRVDACADRDETIMRLAFFAALEDYNGIIEVEVDSEKVRNKAYQTSRWSGSGVPATVDSAKMEREADSRD